MARHKRWAEKSLVNWNVIAWVIKPKILSVYGTKKKEAAILFFVSWLCAYSSLPTHRDTQTAPTQLSAASPRQQARFPAVTSSRLVGGLGSSLHHSHGNRLGTPMREAKPHWLCSLPLWTRAVVDSWLGGARQHSLSCVASNSSLEELSEEGH